MIQCALIIDDEEDICILLSSYLRKKNIDTHYSLSLKEGLKKISELHPTLLFLDNNLPDGSGIDTIPQIRSMSKKIKIIVISAMTNLKEKAFSNSADAFIDKPISFENILSIIS
jgi:DNA-binding response OmpR family regulator